MVLSKKNQVWEEGRSFYNHCVCMCVCARTHREVESALVALINNAVGEGGGKRTSSLIQMTHKDTRQQKTDRGLKAQGR